MRIGRKRSSEASKMASTEFLPCSALGFECEVDNHDAVLLDDADQQDDADDGDDVEVLAEEAQRQQRADTGGRQGGENGEWDE